MSITDELRKEADRLSDEAARKSEHGFSPVAMKLEGIADRIDAEMVELPISADGKIWTGREACFWTNAEQAGYHSFGCVGLRDGRWYVEDVYGMYYEAESVWHERHDSSDSWERIADELEGLSVDSMVGDIDLLSSCALDLAKRIRRLAKKEG